MKDTDIKPSTDNNDSFLKPPTPENRSKGLKISLHGSMKSFRTSHFPQVTSYLDE